jgi:two-component system nitrate/nitrite response regulator NarL
MNDLTPASHTRLLVLDNHNLFRASIARLLATEPDLQVIGECGTAAEALSIIERSHVDLVLLEFEFGGEHASGFITAASVAGYQGGFLIVTESADVQESAIALRLGAAGVFLKSEPPERLVQAINHVMGGGIWLNRATIQTMAGQLMQRDPLVRLDERERSVLVEISKGHTNRQIGEALGLSESSVKNVLQRLFGKTGAKKRSQLVVVAVEGSLFNTPDSVGQGVNKVKRQGQGRIV